MKVLKFEFIVQNVNLKRNYHQRDEEREGEGGKKREK